MSLPGGPLLTAPTGSQHYIVGSAIGYAMQPDNTAGTVTGFEFMLTTFDGSNVNVINRRTVTGVSLPANNPITLLSTVSEPIPNSPSIFAPVQYYCWGRTQNSEGWGPVNRAATYVANVNTPPYISPSTAYPSGTVTVAGTSVAPTFSVQVLDGQSDPITFYQAYIRNAVGTQIWTSGKVACFIPAGGTLTFSSMALPVDGAALNWYIQLWDGGMSAVDLPSTSIQINFSLISGGGGGGGGGGGTNLPPVLNTSYPLAPSGVQNIPSGGTAYTPIFSAKWTDPEGATMASYRVQIFDVANITAVFWDSGEVSSAIANNSIVNVTGPQLHTGPHYKWQMQVRDNVGNLSTYTTLTEFWGQSVVPLNQPPTVAFSSPSGLVGTVTPTFTFAFYDPVITNNIFTSYQVQVQRADGSQVMWNSPTFLTSSAEKAANQANVPYNGQALTYGVSYRWHAQVTDDGGLSSPTSNTDWVTFVPQHAPDVPSGLAPNGVLTALTFSFTGNYTTSGAATLTTVQAQVRTDTGALLWDSGNVPAMGASFSFPYAGPPLIPGEHITYIVRVVDSNGLASAYSSPITLTILNTPNAPINLAPPNSSFTVWPTFAPTFAGDDSNPAGNLMNAAEVIVYRFDATTSDPTLLVTLWDSNWVAQTTERFNIPYQGGTALAPGTAIYWRARTRDSVTGFAGAWSALQTLIINTPPLQPTNLLPFGGSNIPSTTPTLTWTVNQSEVGAHGTTGAPDGLRQLFYQIDIVNQQTNTSFTGFPKYSADVYADMLTNTLTAGVGTFSVSGGRGSFAPLNNAYAYRATSISDAYIGALVKYDSSAAAGSASLGGGAGLIFRWLDVNNFWIAVLDSGNLVLRKCVSGAFTTIASATNVNVSSGYDQHLLVYAAGATITVYLNGVAMFNATDSFAQTGVVHGLYANNSSLTTFDMFYVCNDTAAGLASITPTLTAETPYSWRVRSFDAFVFGAYSNDAQFTTVSAPQVAVTYPVAGQTQGSPTPTITWTFTPSGGRPQASYQVQIFNNTQLVYTTGVVMSAATSFVVPTGILLNGYQYAVTVQVTDTLTPVPLSSVSNPVPFLALWTPSPAVGGFTATADTTNAQVILTWQKTVVAPSEFLRYEIMRTIPGKTPVLIRKITDPNTLTVTDYFAPSGALVTYTMSQVRQVGVDEISGAQTFATAQLNFKQMWVSDVEDPGNFFFVMVDNPQRQFTPRRDEGDSRYWGSKKMVRHVGIGAWQEFSVTADVLGPDAAVNPTEDGTPYIAMIQTILDRKNPICYRDARGRQLFANIAVQITDNLPANWSVQLTLVECEFVEAQ